MLHIAICMQGYILFLFIWLNFLFNIGVRVKVLVIPVDIILNILLCFVHTGCWIIYDCFVCGIWLCFLSDEYWRKVHLIKMINEPFESLTASSFTFAFIRCLLSLRHVVSNCCGRSPCDVTFDENRVQYTTNAKNGYN